MNIRMIRVKHGWTQKQLAAHIGASISTIQAWEQIGKDGNPLRNPDEKHIEKLKALV